MKNLNLNLKGTDCTTDTNLIKQNLLNFFKFIGTTAEFKTKKRKKRIKGLKNESTHFVSADKHDSRTRFMSGKKPKFSTKQK